MLADATIARLVSLTVIGTGSDLPGVPVDTDTLLRLVSPYVSPEDVRLGRRIAGRLRIHSRHIARDFGHAAENPRAADTAPRIAARALLAALTAGKCDSNSIKYLLSHTATPHTPLPSNAAWVADEIAYRGPYVELRQACTGFAAATLYAAALQQLSIGPIAIVGSELGSTLFDPTRIATDRSQLINLVQMGDGAGAVVLGGVGRPDSSRIEFIYCGGSGLGRTPGLMIPEGGSGNPRVTANGVPHFWHRAEDIRAHGLDLLKSGIEICDAAGFNRGNIAWWIPHQANGRMAELCAQHLDLPRERVICDAGTVGNLGSAAIWVTLDRLRRSGRLSAGDRVAILGAEATKYMFGGMVYVHGVE